MKCTYAGLKYISCPYAFRQTYSINAFSFASLPPGTTLQNTGGICCSVVAHGQKAPPFIGFSPPRIFNWSLQSPGLNTENSHLTQIYVLNSQIMQPELSKRDQNVRILLNKERSQWSCFLLHRFHLSSEVKEVAVGSWKPWGTQRSLSLNPSLSYLHFCSCLWLFRAGLLYTSNAMHEYIYCSLLFLKILIYIFRQERFSANPCRNCTLC